MARDMRRQLASGQAFAANSPVSFDLPRDSVYSSILLSLEYAASTGVGITLEGPFDRAPWGLVKRIEIIADGKDTIKSYDGPMLVDINDWDYGAYPPTGQVLELLASTTNGTAAEPLWHGLVINFGSKAMVEEMDPKTGLKMGGPQMTFLDARKLSSLELRVTFGAGLADIFTTVTGAAVLDRYVLTPWGHEILDLDRNSTFAVNQETMTSTAFPANTATERQFRMNVGNAYRRIFLHTVDQNARAAVERLERIVLQENGVFNRRIWDAGALKAFMALSHQLGVGLWTGTQPAERNAVPLMVPAIGTTGKQGGSRVGFFCVDIAEDGRVGSLLDTRGYSDLSLLLNWDGANTTDLIRICPSIIVPNVR